MENNCWLYKGKCLETPPEGYYGYIYLIVTDYNTENERYYIGKKAFTHSSKKRITKKVIKETGTRKRVERVSKDSGWLSYYGSCKPLLEHIKGKEHTVRRYILKLCEDKQSLAYWEAHYLFKNEVLFNDSYWNGNILSKFFKGRISK